MSNGAGQGYNSSSGTYAIGKTSSKGVFLTGVCGLLGTAEGLVEPAVWLSFARGGLSGEAGLAHAWCETRPLS